MRSIRPAVVALALVAGAAVVPAPIVSARATGDVSDPKLLQALAEARATRTEGGPEPTVAVEVLAAGDGAAIAAIAAAGGTVTGSVPGEVVQARVPVSAVGALAGAAGVEYVRAPRRAGYLVSPDRPTRLESGPGFGTTVGDAVALTNADDWQAAGLDGTGVKVGVVDYFDLGSWQTGESGPVPDGAHTFCQDSLFPPPDPDSYCTSGSAFNPVWGDEHGPAVVEIVKDMAPGAEIFVATVGTASDLQAAVNWFKTKGVTIITRSLGAAYDGPGDGTGPLAAVVDSAVAQGMTWFNSAGNDAIDLYMQVSVPTTLAANGYVDFDGTAGTDTYLRLDGLCILLDGIRWANDWYLPTAQKTDYLIEFWEPTTDISANGDHYNPTSGQLKHLDLDPDTLAVEWTWDTNQRTGGNPLEAEDLFFCPDNFFGDFQGISYIRIKRNSATSVGTTADTMEIALGQGLLELDYYDVNGSAAKPVVDSKSGGLVAVGAVDPPAGTAIGDYSSQGPTTDGRVKPDVSAPAGFYSATYNDTFARTSAASPVAAGMAAVLQSAGLAMPGAPTAALVKHFVTDLGPLGKDNAFGEGKVQLPAPPGAAPATNNSAFQPLSPARLLNTRPSFHVGPAALIGPYAPDSIIELPVLGVGGVPGVDVSAVAVNITSVDTTRNGYIQAAPYLRAAIGSTSTLNISTAGAARPNFAIVPVGVDGKITLYLQVGGNVIVDVMGYFTDTGGTSTTSSEGRFVPLASPERWMDTRGLNSAPLPASFLDTPRAANAGETIVVPTFATTTVPTTGVAALVVNVTAATAAANGYLRADPNGGAGPHSTVNFTPASASANTAIVPLSGGSQLFDGGEISVFASQSVNVIVDVVGYITDDTAADVATGLFRPITPGRAVDTRPSSAFIANEVRSVTLTGLSAPAPVVPVGAAGVSANLTVVTPAANGNLKAYPNGEPTTSTLNYASGKTVANGALLGLSATGTVTVKMSAGGHVLLDVNGYFLA